MTTIEIKIQAFGAVQRQLPQGLSLQFKSDIYITDVLKDIAKKFPDSAKLLDRCACAMGEDIVPRQTLLTAHSTVVLLSPVAGG